MKYLRIDIIKSKLKTIEENINLVKEHLPENLEEFILLGLVKDGIYKKIESSIQDILSICAIINSDLKLGIPSNRDDLIKILVENKVISTKLGEVIKELKGFRNFLIYRYGKINDEIAFNDIKSGISDFKTFNDHILEYLKKFNEKNQN